MTDTPTPRPNIYNRLGGLAAIVMVVCWLALVPALFVIASATASNRAGTVLWGARLAEALVLGGLVCLVLTVAFYALGAWRGGGEA